MRAVVFFLAVAGLLTMAFSPRAQCPLAKYCCGGGGLVICSIEPTTPGLVCICPDFHQAQGHAC